jgi:trafficking protein particle complex subunit 8
VIKIEVEEERHRLLVNFVDDSPLALAQGETKSLTLWLCNAGTKPINEIWMVARPEDEIWLSTADGSQCPPFESHPGSLAETEVLPSRNSLQSQRPLRVPLPAPSQSPILNPHENVELLVTIHDQSVGDQELYLLFVYREVCAQAFSLEA